MKKLIFAVAMLGMLSTGVASASTTISLNSGPGYPTLLGVSCGGVHTSTYVTGFDASGNITGEVYAWTRCGLSGRGGGYKSHMYSSWHSFVWSVDDGAILQILPYDGVAPDTSFTATDVSGNTISDLLVSGSYLGQLVKP